MGAAHEMIRNALKADPKLTTETVSLLSNATTALDVAHQLAHEGHNVRGIRITPEHGLPCVELEPSHRLVVMAETGCAAFNSYGRDEKGPFRRGTFTRNGVRVVWTDRRH